MRQINIIVQKRLNVDTDNEFLFESFNPLGNENVYQLESLVLNYSVISSQITSTMILGMNAPVNNSNVLRSGQPITVTDNDVVVFEGVILQPQYVLVPMSDDQPGGMYLFATLAPSIYQLTLTPVVFDSDQADQIQQTTGVNIGAVLAAGVTQKISTDALLTYVIKNTTYSNVFNKTISPQDLADQLFMMTSIGASRDVMIRQSIDYYNCVMYQQEDGEIRIRQLDAALESPFDIDLQNLYTPNGIINLPQNDNSTIPFASLLSYEYNDNAYSTPAAISNFAIIDGGVATVAKATKCILTYAPNTQFFPQIELLKKGGWFVGQTGVTQINNNIIEDPTTATALNNFFKEPDAYMVASQATGVKQQFLAAYQALLTAKQMGMALAGYASLSGTISLDDPALASISDADMGKVLGTVIQIQNCDLTAGLIATVSRSYNAQGSYMAFNIVPRGSYTGFWRNSKFTPNSN